MPATANSRGLADPFDPIESIAHSAKLLSDLRRELGNLGLAAAAYNAGPGRVRDWLAGRRGLPRETDAYVRLITGQSPERWARGQASPAEMHVANAVPCQQMAWSCCSLAGPRDEASGSLGRAISGKLVG